MGGEEKMNLKKNLVKIFAIMLFAIFAIVQTKGVYAQTQNPAVCMGITALMTECTPKMGYSIKKPGTEGASNIIQQIQIVLQRQISIV